MITFAEPKAIVRAVEEKDWTVGTYQIEDDGWEDATNRLLVRGAAEAMGDNPDVNYILVPGLVPFVETGGITYIVPHLHGTIDRRAMAWPSCGTT